MSSLARLVTFVDLHEARVSDRQLAVSARHEVVLTDGSRVLLLDDRGWTESGPADIWSTVSVEDIVDTARVVVGPDEPFNGHSAQDMEADHWAYLAQILRQSGIDADADQLRHLPHDVVLSDQLLARVARGSRTREPGTRD